MQFVLLMAAGFVVFLLLFGVLALKSRVKNEPVHIHHCPTCNCGKEPEDPVARALSGVDPSARRCKGAAAPLEGQEAGRPGG